MSNVHYLRLRQRDTELLDKVSPERQRNIAVEFLLSSESMSQLLERCGGPDEKGHEARTTLNCVLLMVKDDAPTDLIFQEPGVYRRLRERVTDLRVKGWIAPPGRDAVR